MSVDCMSSVNKVKHWNHLLCLDGNVGVEDTIRNVRRMLCIEIAVKI